MSDLIDRSATSAEMVKHAKGTTVIGGQTFRTIKLEDALDAIAALPAVSAPALPLRWFQPEGSTFAEMQERARNHPSREGDTILVWVNEGDLYNHSVPFFRPAVSAPDVAELVEALRALADEYACPMNESEGPAYRKARAALARIGGQ